ncbi:alpha-hydroxy acid oxidase [Metabacillus rhizolycopersici]|uniref:L-lactate oxidase n=1 Tax=Metabacillus rhizolycopersici TaxID=2875709 RepID=A0ABS7UXY0_9BACI|nr:alpha-hydroxy acid oxidase [Metabacillus rhizolycopersici]MBZ5752837.1 alpha-hydroxy-acid oxidizing protein [Metabacillus rhizolycopersici]
MNPIEDKDVLLQNISSSEYFPITYKELEQEAKQTMSVGGFGYVRSGAGNEETLRKNEESFSKLSFLPRFLRDVSELDTSVQLFGRTYPYPIFLAPVGMQKLAHKEGEIASAKAAATHRVPFVLSTVSSYSIEDVANATGDSPKWFQLYWSNNEEISFNMVKRAEEAGFEAIVLTIDTPMLGWRVEDIRNRFSPLKLGLGKANYEADPVFLRSLENQDAESIIHGILNNINHPTLNWKHVAALKERTSLPILLKGILHPEDARLAVENGIDGIIVSNHGGRQLDGVISAIDALPLIVEEVKGAVPVLFDSGIRRGTDVVKALALGADAVFIGRPFIYGLAVDGQNGVEKVLANFIEETKISISLAGISSVKDLPALKIVTS